VIVDSPRWPRDLDCSYRGVRRRDGDCAGRTIDIALRRIIKESIDQPVAMFPTPRIDYFIGQLSRDGCKPHLRAFGNALFGSMMAEKHNAKGGTFTRFMLTGFATYRALAMLGVESYEGYPDLQFRLWNKNRPLPSKNGGKSIAIAQRRHVLAELATYLRCTGDEAVATLDEADASILALGGIAAAGDAIGVTIEHHAEGRLMVSFPANARVAFDD